MGSESVPLTKIHVTGFKKFHGVAKNPTEVIVSRLFEYIKDCGRLPPGCTLESCTVLETAGEGGLKTLIDLLDGACRGETEAIAAGAGTEIPKDAVPTHRKLGDLIAQPETESGPPALAQRVIWVHLGVNSGATKFAIERRAVNEATFRCPDELGWQPQRVPIIHDDGSISTFRETSLPAAEIVKSLSAKGYEVTLSDDAGRFVCNYVYYQSLCHASANGTLCLFVHVPLFARIEEEIQLRFVATLLDVLAELQT